MRLAPSLAFAGIVTVLAGTAVAVKPADHVMTVMLPSGQTAQVHYVGDVAPRVVVQPAAPMSVFDSAFGPDSVFADLDRMSAEMDAHRAAMMRQASVATAPGTG